MQVPKLYTICVYKQSFRDTTRESGDTTERSGDTTEGSGDITEESGNTFKSSFY